MTNAVACLLLVASWERNADIGKLEASGLRYDPHKMTCACNLFPLGTVLSVREMHNGLSVVVVVTDRINERYSRSRLDLSRDAFDRLDGLGLGLADVCVTPISRSVVPTTIASSTRRAASISKPRSVPDARD